jgi:hypothetical protein
MVVLPEPDGAENMMTFCMADELVVSHAKVVKIMVWPMAAALSYYRKR